MIGVGGEELQGCHQSGLWFVFTYRPMRERCWRACLQIGDVRPYRSQSAGASYTASAAFSPHGQSVPVPPRPSPPLRPQPRPAAGLRGWSGGRAPGLVRPAPAAAVPSPQAADCPSRRPRSQPPFLGRGCLRRSERASRGYGRPEQVRGAGAAAPVRARARGGLPGSPAAAAGRSASPGASRPPRGASAGSARPLHLAGRGGGEPCRWRGDTELSQSGSRRSGPADEER